MWRDVNQSGGISRAVAKWRRMRLQRAWQDCWKVIRVLMWGCKGLGMG